MGTIRLWLSGLRGEYERRMQTMCKNLEENAYQLKQSTPVRDSDWDWGVITKTKLYEFEWPRGGMFLWLKVHFEAHPLFGAVGSQGNVIDGPALSSALMIFLTHKPFLVLVSPGMMFSATPEIAQRRGWAYYRLCFAAETDEMNSACSIRFGQGVQKFWRIKKVAEIEALLEESGMTAEAEEMEGPKVVPAFYGDDVRSLTLLHAVIEPGRDQSTILSEARASATWSS